MEEQAVYEVKLKPKVSTKKGNLFFLVALIFMILTSIALIFVDILPTTRTMLVEYGLMIVTIIFFIITKQPVKDVMRFNKPGIVNMILIFPLAFCLMPAVGFLSSLTSLFVKNHIAEAISQFPTMSLGMWLFTLAVTPAICEEVIMRGVIFGNYKHVSIKKAALMNGLMFGILHLNINQFVYAFVLGVVMAYIVYYTGSIFPSMLLHFCINGISAFASWVVQVFSEYFDGMTVAEIASKQDALELLPKQAVYAVIGAALAWLIVRTYKVINEGKYEEVEVVEGEKIFDIYIIISIVIFIGFIIMMGA